MALTDIIRARNKTAAAASDNVTLLLAAQVEALENQIRTLLANDKWAKEHIKRLEGKMELLVSSKT